MSNPKNKLSWEINYFRIEQLLLAFIKVLCWDLSYTIYTSQFYTSPHLKETVAIVFGLRNKRVVVEERIELYIHSDQIKVTDKVPWIDLRSVIAIFTLLYPYKNYVNSKAKKMLSQFDYCFPVYEPCLDVDTINRIEFVENNGIIFIWSTWSWIVYILRSCYFRSYCLLVCCYVYLCYS